MLPSIHSNRLIRQLSDSGNRTVWIALAFVGLLLVSSIRPHHEADSSHAPAEGLVIELQQVVPNVQYVAVNSDHIKAFSAEVAFLEDIDGAVAQSEGCEFLVTLQNNDDRFYLLSAVRLMAILSNIEELRDEAGNEWRLDKLFEFAGWEDMQYVVPIAPTARRSFVISLKLTRLAANEERIDQYPKSLSYRILPQGIEVKTITAVEVDAEHEFIRIEGSGRCDVSPSGFK